MKILLINWRDTGHPRSGGAEIVTFEHAKRWVAKGHTVTWLTSGYPNASGTEIKDGVRIVHKGGAFSIYLLVPIYVLFNARSFDVIIDEIHGIPFFSLLFTSKPVVVFIHEIAGEIWDYMFPFPINILGKKLENLYLWLYRKSFFWTDAPSTINELVERGIPRQNCIAIPCPVPVNEKILQPKSSQPVYIFLSRVVQMKGIEEVIKAFAFIHTVQKTAALWIVGGGEETYFRSLRKTVDDYNLAKYVRFFGKVDEHKKRQLLRQAHILLHASVKEGWGLVVLEAAVQETPAVVYNVAGLRDVVLNGKTGIVLTRNSPEEMASEAILLLKDNKRYQKYQNNGIQWVNSFKWDDVIGQSLFVLERATINHSV